MKNNTLKLILCSLLCFSCQTDDLDLFDPDAVRDPVVINTDITFADPNLVQEAKDLHSKLHTITQLGIAFGQQESIGRGINFFDPESLDSDFSRVAGDWPAVIGFDLERIELINTFNFYRPIVAQRKRDLIIKAHNNGSIIALSWHASNPITLEDSFDTTKVVSEMLEGGSKRNLFLLYLEELALFLKDLKDDQGKPIPVLFRPWHEMNGNFFYWGEGHRSTEEFVQLFRDTVTLLSNTFNVHNVLYVYSPNHVSSASAYLKNYPGDAYVDMLGVDIYDFKNGEFLNDAISNLNIVEDIAKEKNMLFALTETGLENVTQSDWWTERLYKAIRSSGMTYSMIWRNATENHFFGPFVGHVSEDNFKTFISKDVILLHSDIQ